MDCDRCIVQFEQDIVHGHPGLPGCNRSEDLGSGSEACSSGDRVEKNDAQEGSKIRSHYTFAGNRTQYSENRVVQTLLVHTRHWVAVSGELERDVYSFNSIHV